MRRILGAALMLTMFWLATGAAPAVAQSDANQVIFTEIEKRAIKRFYEAIGLRNPDRDDGIYRESRYPESRYSEDRHSEDRYSGKHKKSKKWKKHNKGKKRKAHKGKSKRMPQGLVKRHKLPPGLAKRQRLPKGLNRRRLFTNLERQLPPTPVNVERVLVDNNIVLIQKGTNLVLDILENILTR